MRVEDSLAVEVNGVTIMVTAASLDVNVDQADAMVAMNKLCGHIEAIENEQSYADGSE